MLNIELFIGDIENGVTKNRMDNTIRNNTKPTQKRGN